MANKSMLYSLKVGAYVARVVPRRYGLILAGSFASLYGLLPTKRSRILASIHRRVSPDLTKKQLRKRVRDVLSSYSRYWWDVFWLSSSRSTSDIDEIVTLENTVYYEQALEYSNRTEKGIILTLPHMGSWEIPGAWMATHGNSPVVVAERLSPPELFEIFTRTRTDVGLTVIAHDDRPSVRLFEAINEGKMVCLVADRDISRRGIPVTFFGEEKTMPAGPAALSIKSNAVILPVCVYTSLDGHITVHFTSPIIPPEIQEQNKIEAIEQLTQQLSTRFEEMILRDPTQWHVLSDEWTRK